MSEKSKELKQAKKIIAATTREFESRMIKSRNDLERVQILNEMEELLQAEMYKWINFMEVNDNPDIEGNENLIQHVADNVEGLNSVIKTICEGRKELLPGAKALLAVKRRELGNVEPIKHLDYEPK